MLMRERGMQESSLPLPLPHPPPPLVPLQGGWAPLALAEMRGDAGAAAAAVLRADPRVAASLHSRHGARPTHGPTESTPGPTGAPSD